jgi:hypothetical protein
MKTRHITHVRGLTRRDSGVLGIDVINQPIPNDRERRLFDESDAGSRDIEGSLLSSLECRGPVGGGTLASILCGRSVRKVPEGL